MERRQQAAAIATRFAATPADAEAAIRALREEGYSMGECSVALADGLRMDLGAAQSAVLNSRTWADHIPAQTRLNQEFWSAVEQLGTLEPDGSITIDLSTLEDL